MAVLESVRNKQLTSKYWRWEWQIAINDTPRALHPLNVLSTHSPQDFYPQHPANFLSTPTLLFHPHSDNTVLQLFDHRFHFGFLIFNWEYLEDWWQLLYFF